MSDMFNLFMKGDPAVRDRAEMAPSHVPNRELIEAFAKHPEYTNLHQNTIGSLYGSAMGLLSMESEIRTALDKMQRARDLADQLDQAKADGADEQVLEEMASQLGDVAQGDAAGTMLAMRSAARKAAEAAEQEAILMDAFGVDDGDLQTMSFTERRELAKRLANNRLAAFAKTLGAFRAMARAEVRRKVLNVPSEIAGVTLGNDLQRLTSAEMESLAIPELEDDFWLRWSQRRLSNYLLTGTQRQGKGPIIIVCDESGSMDTADLAGATREAWSKGMSLALVDAARREKREVTYLGFSSLSQMVEIDLSPQIAGLEEIIRFTEHFFAGGTHYERALTRALELAEAATSRPDIVFITDDAYQKPSDEFVTRWRQVRQHLSMRCYGIHIGTGNSGALALIADDVRGIDAYVNDVSAVADIFRSL